MYADEAMAEGGAHDVRATPYAATLHHGFVGTN